MKKCYMILIPDLTAIVCSPPEES